MGAGWLFPKFFTAHTWPGFLLQEAGIQMEEEDRLGW